MNNKPTTIELTLKITAPFSLWVELINEKKISIKEFLGFKQVRISPDIILHPPKEDNK